MKRRALRDEPLFFERNPNRRSRQGVLLPKFDKPSIDPTSVLPAESLLDDHKLTKKENPGYYHI